MAKVKGQNLRLYFDGVVLAASTSCQLSVNAEVESVSTKDDATIWDEKEVTRLNWSAQTDALVCIDSVDDAYVLSEFLAKIEDKEFTDIELSLSNGIEQGPTYLFGAAVITDISVNAQNGSHATMTVNLKGMRDLEVQSPLSIKSASSPTEDAEE